MEVDLLVMKGIKGEFVARGEHNSKLVKLSFSQN